MRLRAWRRRCRLCVVQICPWIVCVQARWCSTNHDLVWKPHRSYQANTSVSARPSPLRTFCLSRERPQRRVARKDKWGETVLYVGYTPRDHDDLPTQAILKSVTLVIMQGVTCQASIIRQHRLPHPVGADTVETWVGVFHHQGLIRESSTSQLKW